MIPFNHLIDRVLDKVTHLRWTFLGNMFLGTKDELLYAASLGSFSIIRGSEFKVFKETNQGLEWLHDADKYRDFITNKHKSNIGVFIPME